MILLEYEAKQILSRHDVPVPRGVIYSNDAPFSVPFVAKSQVPTGGRGKAGGIVVVEKADAVESTIQSLLHLNIKSHTPRHIFIEELVDIDREFYLALSINRTKSCIDIIAHSQGGVEIESQSIPPFVRAITPANIEAIAQHIADLFTINDKAFLLADTIEKIYSCFIKEDATLLEINPLALTQQGTLLALDCKMELDDYAHHRHPEWNFEHMPASSNFVTLNAHGTVATLANGAGLAMATVDAVTDLGYAPANFLDIGGGATTESLTSTFHELMKYPDLTAIVINIFGGIVHCDVVAEAIIAAKNNFANLPPLFVRLSGTNSQQAIALLKTNGIPASSTFTTCLDNLQRSIKP